MVTKIIIEEFNLDITNQYLDGTKIEANANKYKLVWKPTTFHKKFDIKIKEYVIRENIDINYISTGKGRCLTKKQKNYKLAYQYLIKLLEYEEKEQIYGKNRNSYFKRIKMQQQWC